MTYLIVSDSDERLVGALVCWQTESRSVQWDDLHREWTAARLPVDLLIKPVTDAKAMRRALDTAGRYLDCDDKHRNLVRPIRRGRVASLVRERVEGVTKEDDDDGTLRHSPLVRGIVNYSRDGNSGNSVRFEPEVGHEHDVTIQRMVAVATDSVNDLRGRIMDVDVQRWCRRLVRACGGIEMRRAGGFYFIPRAMEGRPGIMLWRRIAAVLGSAASITLHSVPAMRTSDTVATVLDGLIHHVTTSCERVQRELQSGKLGSEATVTRARQLETLTADVEAFETLLGRNLTELRQKIESLTTLSVFTTLAATAQLTLPSEAS